MRVLDAAYQVLKQAKGALHYSDIAARAMAQGLIELKTQTPEATMGSRLYMATKRPDSLFRRVGRGTFALVQSQPSDIEQRIAALNLKTRDTLRERLHTMPADRFEALVGELLVALGFDESTVQVTAYSGDGGIDVRGVLHAGGITTFNAAVQVKRWKKNIQAPTVRELRGSLTVHEQGMIITTSGFSSGAQAEAVEAGKSRISLIDGERLLDLLVEHNIGVTQEQHTVLSLDEEWWGEVAGEPAVEPAPSLPAVTASPGTGYPLRMQATVNGHPVEAELLDAAGRTRYEGVEYRSPSGAGQAAAGWKSCNGWLFWRYQDPETGEWRAINELRGE